MKFKRIENYLVYIQENERGKKIIEESSSRIYKRINISNRISSLEDVTNISFMSKAHVISSVNQNNENINIIDVYIGMRIEFEYNECISSELIEIEKGDIFKSSGCISNINISINTIAIGINDEEGITVSIIYSLYI